jgi:hypothetical protein
MTSGGPGSSFFSAHPPFKGSAMKKLGPSPVPGKKAGPNGSFPIGDPKHARLAIGGATRSFNAGNISKGTENHIKAEARSELANAEGQRSAPHLHNMGRHGK